jgi:hypothetical protein
VLVFPEDLSNVLFLVSLKSPVMMCMIVLLDIRACFSWVVKIISKHSFNILVWSTAAAYTDHIHTSTFENSSVTLIRYGEKTVWETQCLAHFSVNITATPNPFGLSGSVDDHKILKLSVASKLSNMYFPSRSFL